MFDYRVQAALEAVYYDLIRCSRRRRLFDGWLIRILDFNKKYAHLQITLLEHWGGRDAAC